MAIDVMARKGSRRLIAFGKKAFLCLILTAAFLPSSFAAGPPAVITVQPQSQTVSLYDPVTFSVQVTSGTTITYQWRTNGINISGATLSSYTIPSVTYNDQQIYSVKVVNGGGTVFSSNATLTVLSPPVITSPPQNATVVQGQNGSFSVGATGSDPLKYQWSVNGSLISGATNSALTVNGVQSSNAGSYSVVVSNGFGAVTSSVATLVLQSVPLRLNGTANDHDYLQAMILDEQGNVYLTGYAKESASATYDYVTVKYDAQDNLIWRAAYDGGAARDDQAVAVAVDKLGNVYVTGASQLSAGAGGWDYVTIKYDANGNEVWVNRFNSPANKDDLATAIAVDAGGNVYVTGQSKNLAGKFQYRDHPI